MFFPCTVGVLITSKARHKVGLDASLNQSARLMNSYRRRYKSVRCNEFDPDDSYVLAYLEFENNFERMRILSSHVYDGRFQNLEWYRLVSDHL